MRHSLLVEPASARRGRAGPVGRTWPVRRWVVACLVAEGIGMTAAAAAAEAANGLRALGFGAAVALAVVVVGGVVEGCALGVLQGRVVGRALGAVIARRWAAVTAVVAGVGWAAASAPSAFAAPEGPVGEVPLGVTLLGAGALGATMGALLGAAQSAVLRGHLARPWRWTWVSATAWTPAMVVVFVGAGLPASAWPTWAVVLTGTVTGLAAGGVLGLVSGPLMAGPGRVRPADESCLV